VRRVAAFYEALAVAGLMAACTGGGVESGTAQQSAHPAGSAFASHADEAPRREPATTDRMEPANDEPSIAWCLRHDIVLRSGTSTVMMRRGLGPTAAGLTPTVRL
jgi:hypothetical protein